MSHTPDAASGNRDFWVRLQRIDRRWIFLVLFVGVVVPYFTPLGCRVRPSDPTRKLYDFIDKLPERKPVMISFDYGPGSAAELDPMAVAIARHCFKKNLRLIGVTLDPTGALLIRKAFEKAGKDLGKKMHEDWVSLGYKPGGGVVVLGIGGGLDTVFATDSEGKPYGEIPALEGVRNYDDIGIVVDLASSAAPDIWIRYAREAFKANLACGVTGVMVAAYYPYLQTGQFIGILGGLKGAAEYEQLTEAPGDGQIGMDSQSVAHLIVIALVILGNVASIASRRGPRG
ncbi:MAG TPA: hypothetical protein PLD23_20770 [Armatimonadota bacterium]|nr:hypothetical protein [Armatimonadota bacterium]HQK95943.1 hypothetical protein [Armatimonadota bacterium]